MTNQSLNSLGFAVLLFAGCAIACGDLNSNKNESSSSPSPTSEGKPVSSPNNQSTSSTAVIAISADALFRDYKKNEVAADLKYKDKQLEVTGVVHEIASGTFSGAWVDLAGGSVRCGFEDERKEPVARLEKGQAIVVRCTGDRMTLGTVFLKDCSVK